MKRQHIKLVLTFISVFLCLNLAASHVSLPEKKPTFDIHALEKNEKVAEVIPVAIIGAGPAGISAAIYTARAKLPTYVFTGGNFGGHLNEIQRIENWPALQKTTGAFIAQSLKEQAESFGVHFINETIKEVNFSKWPFILHNEFGDTIQALSVIIATGFIQKQPNIPGAKKYEGKGIGVCTICDAPFVKNQEVVVIGSDDFAAEKVVQLAAYAKKVTMVTSKPHLVVTPVVHDYLNELSNLTIKTNEHVVEIEGNEARVTGVRIQDKGTKQEMVVPAQSIFLNSSYQPNSDIFKDYLKRDAEGYIEVKPGIQETSVPGVYAAGSVSNKPNKAGPAAGYGMCAGAEVITFMTTKVGFSPALAESLKSRFYVPKPKKTDQNIESINSFDQLEKAFDKKRVTVLFCHSETCHHCKAMYPDIAAVAQEFKDTVSTLAFKIQDNADLVHQLSLTSVPTTIIFRDGKAIETLHGKQEKSTLEAAFHKALKETAEVK